VLRKKDAGRTRRATRRLPESARPPESLSPTTGAPFCTARSITLQIFSAWASDSEPAEHG